MSGLVDEIHVLHQLVVFQIRKPLPNPRIVERDEGDPAATIVAGKPVYLPVTELTLAVKENQVCLRIGLTQLLIRFVDNFGHRSLIKESLSPDAQPHLN